MDGCVQRVVRDTWSACLLQVPACRAAIGEATEGDMIGIVHLNTDVKEILQLNAFDKIVRPVMADIVTQVVW